jgi:hypothetical protein
MSPRTLLYVGTGATEAGRSCLTAVFEAVDGPMLRADDVAHARAQLADTDAADVLIVYGPDIANAARWTAGEVDNLGRDHGASVVVVDHTDRMWIAAAAMRDLRAEIGLVLPAELPKLLDLQDPARVARY